MMQEELSRAQTLRSSVNSAMQKLNITNLGLKLTELKKDSQQPNFWQDNQSAQAKMKKIADIEGRINPWQELLISVNEVIELLELGDGAMQTELNQQINDV